MKYVTTFRVILTIVNLDVFKGTSDVTVTSHWYSYSQIKTQHSILLYIENFMDRVDRKIRLDYN